MCRARGRGLLNLLSNRAWFCCWTVAPGGELFYKHKGNRVTGLAGRLVLAAAGGVLTGVF